MRLTLSRYSAILSFQTLLFLIDFGINTFWILVRRHIAITLILFILQDVCIILALAILLLTFFSTYVFHAGLVELLYDRFRLTVIICMLYFIMTTVLHVWTLAVRWGDPLKHNWSTSLQVFYVLQKFMAPIYYYYYKRASLRIADPRFYEEVEWEQKSINH